MVSLMLCTSKYNQLYELARDFHIQSQIHVNQYFYSRV